MKALIVLALLAAPAYATPYSCKGVPSGVAPSRTSIEKRVRMQHALLEVGKESGSHQTAHLARELAMAIAPTANELDDLGPWPYLQGVLGPTLVERATQTCGTGNSIHVAYNGGLFAFRPLRAGTTHALVSQIVAFDREGHPHVTPFVDAIEMRLGDSIDAPACVVEASPDGALRPERLDRVTPRPPFVQHTPEGLGCNGCHSGANTFGARDITGDELVHVDELRTEQVEKLAEGFWQSLGH